MANNEIRTENLILSLCTLWSKETKKARNEEKKIIKELAKRNIVDEDYMNKLMEG